MLQRDLLLPWLNARDNAARAAGRGIRSRTQAARASGALVELDFEGFEHAQPAELSGGMRQRVAFLRTLLSGKPVLCLDEPFGALDAITRGEMQDWLAQALAREPRTVVLVTHDVEEAIVLADRVAVPARGRGVVTEEPRDRTCAGPERVRRMRRSSPCASRCHACTALGCTEGVTAEEPGRSAPDGSVTVLPRGLLRSPLWAGSSSVQVGLESTYVPPPPLVSWWPCGTTRASCRENPWPHG